MTSHGIDGSVIAQATINEGSDAEPLLIATANGAVWVAISKGCLTGGCEKRTLIFDLAQQRARADGVARRRRRRRHDERQPRHTRSSILPSEIRSYDVSDPFHPAQLVTHATEGARRAALDRVREQHRLRARRKTLHVRRFVAGENQRTSLDAYVNDPAGVVTFADQQIRADGNCAVVSGRAFSPLTFALPAFSASTSFATPAVVKSIASTNGRSTC